MNFIVTAGGTKERIDSVRYITNSATGRLGSLIAEEFLRQIPEHGESSLYYLCPTGAFLPDTGDPRIKIVPVEGTDDLQKSLKALLTGKRIDAVVHSMAVSDYKTETVTTLEKFASSIAEKLASQNSILSPPQIRQIVEQSILEPGIDTGAKLSSNMEHPIVVLKRTPKVIEMIKSISPQTVLVGFKLLTGVEKKVLLNTAYGLMLKNGCDFVLANDSDSMVDGRHTGYLLDRGKHIVELSGKKTIAVGIVNAVMEKLEGGQ